MTNFSLLEKWMQSDIVEILPIQKLRIEIGISYSKPLIPIAHDNVRYDARRKEMGMTRIRLTLVPTLGYRICGHHPSLYLCHLHTNTPYFSCTYNTQSTYFRRSFNPLKLPLTQCTLISSNRNNLCFFRNNRNLFGHMHPKFYEIC